MGNSTQDLFDAAVPRSIPGNHKKSMINGISRQRATHSVPQPAAGCSVMFWIDRVLISLAAMLFLMMVTAQLYIYFGIYNGNS